MENLPVMKSLQTSDDLNEDVPNLLLLDVSLTLLVAANLLEHISVVGVLHDQAIESILVT